MDTTNSAALSPEPESETGLRERLSNLFGGYRAEWLGESLFDLFTAPDYLPELLTPRPCFLIGGRGTGKTTVLRGLSFEGQRALAPDSDPHNWSYFGFYSRVNTNRVRAFEGPELPEAQWIRAFAHYLNLTLTEELLRLVVWLEERFPGEAWPLATEMAIVGESLHLPVDAGVSPVHFAAAFRAQRVRFEAAINNVADGLPGDLTLLGQPVDLLCETLKQHPLYADKQFFFLMDEFENLSDYQQGVTNTLIKHSGDLYTFKIGVKDLGIRRTTTLNEFEHLQSPADFERINITTRLRNGSFKLFAERICNSRLNRLADSHLVYGDVRSLLPGLSEAEEAERLGVASQVREVRAAIRHAATDEDLEWFDKLAPLEAYLVGFWARAQHMEPISVLHEAMADPDAWRGRLTNYQHSMLFTLRRRKRGIHKYYCGWDTYALLADGNIRYLLQLVFEALLAESEASGKLADPVSFDNQTVAAQTVGRKNLTELEGLAVNGAQVTRLVLGLGRIFQVMARQAEGHAPEVNQFVVNVPAADSAGLNPYVIEGLDVEDLLRAAVMHLALVRTTANKLPASSGDTKEYDYSLHAIYAPFFEFSHRRKRRMTLSVGDIAGIVNTPRSTINKILAHSSRDPSEGLPEQLALFAPYFDAS